MTGDLSDEFKLLAACCRWPAAPEAVQHAAAAPIDWNGFQALVRRHRVPALALNSLAKAGIEMPKPVGDALSSYANAARLKSLSAARENLRLQQLLDDAGIPNMSIKGASVAVLAYGDPSVKFSHDVDILTPPDQLAVTFGVLEKAGFGMSPSPGGRVAHPQGAALELMAEFRSQQPFADGRTGIPIEIHWRLFDNRLLLPAYTATMRTQAVAIGGGAIRTLPDEALFAYLSAHGALHGWSRLKWIADVAAFLHGRDVEHLYRAADRAGAGRTAATALLLCERLFGVSIPAPLVQKVRRNRHAARLAALSLEYLTIGGDKENIEVNLWQRGALIVAGFGLMPGLRYRWAEFKMRCDCYADRVDVPLPKALGFLYIFLRIPMTIGRRVKRRIAQTAS